MASPARRLPRSNSGQNVSAVASNLVTASYIICAVIAAPALTKLGVPDFAAHMFIFHHAMLSALSPPTALSPFAAAAITGGDPYKTTMQACPGVSASRSLTAETGWVDSEDRAGIAAEA